MAVQNKEGEENARYSSGAMMVLVRGDSVVHICTLYI